MWYHIWMICKKCNIIAIRNIDKKNSNNNKLLEITQQEAFSKATTGKWNWLDNTLRKDKDNIFKQALEY